MSAPPSRFRVAALCVVLGGAACDKAEERSSSVHHEPMREAPVPLESASANAEPGASAGEPAASIASTPSIERTLDLIAASERTFIDQAGDPEDKASEYTAAQFASMLRTKWEWIGYDLQELAPWLDEIATRSFKSNLPYLVTLEDGTTSELRAWLDAQLAVQE